MKSQEKINYINPNRVPSESRHGYEKYETVRYGIKREGDINKAIHSNSSVYECLHLWVFWFIRMMSWFMRSHLRYKHSVCTSWKCEYGFIFLSQDERGHSVKQWQWGLKLGPLWGFSFNCMTKVGCLERCIHNALYPADVGCRSKGSCGVCLFNK